MVSLPLLPLELDVVDVDPPLIMHELKTSLPFHPDTRPSSPRGENWLCSDVGLPWFTSVGPLRIL
jgi:hypothetical protein